jgi:hypothetical protein
MRSLTSLVILILSATAHAGGSSERVLVTSLKRLSSTEYILVVSPQPTGYSPADPYMGSCKTFTVHGDYKRLRGSWFRSDTHATREAHIKSLDYLERAMQSQDWIFFGWMGNGFVAVDEKDPCNVRSRALALFDYRSDRQVLSYHDAT